MTFSTPKETHTYACDPMGATAIYALLNAPSPPRLRPK
jgi:hypothetical protein